MLPHHIVEGAAETWVKVVVDKVEGIATDQRRHALTRRSTEAMVAIAYQPAVGEDLENRAAVNALKADLSVCVARRQARTDGDDLNIRNLHGQHLDDSQWEKLGPCTGGPGRSLGSWCLGGLLFGPWIDFATECREVLDERSGCFHGS